MAQADPLAMAAYVIGILSLIKPLKAEVTGITQPWYADNVGALSTFAIIKLYFIYDSSWDVVITPNHLKLFWLCTQIISKPENVWLASRIYGLH